MIGNQQYAGDSNKCDKLMEVISMAKLEIETKTVMSMAIINTIGYSIASIAIAN